MNTLTTVGSLVGLATGIFTVWDRWARWRPIAYSVAKTNFFAEKTRPP